MTYFVRIVFNIIVREENPGGREIFGRYSAGVQIGAQSRAE